MVATVVVVVPRLGMPWGRRGRVPCNLVPVGGPRWLDMPVCGSLRDMLGWRMRLGRHCGRSPAFCRSAAFGRSHCRSTESAAKSESHHQFLKCPVVHGRVPFFITRKLILALTQG